MDRVARAAARGVAIAAALGALGCGTPASAPVGPQPRPTPDAQPAAPDAVDPRLAEQLAAIEWAMNQLDDAAPLCWAAAAVDDFRLAGRITARLAFPAAGPPAVALVVDEPGDAVLSTCLRELLEGSAWPPPLAGQTFELPFEFQAPRAQYVVDRALVPAGDGGVTPLLFERNTGNRDVALDHVRVPAAAPGASGPGIWYVPGPAKLTIGKRTQAVAAGSVVIAPAGKAMQLVSATGQAFEAPRLAASGRDLGRDVRVLPRRDADAARVDGRVSTVIGSPRRGAVIGAGVVHHVFSAGTGAPTHEHAGETEVVYVLRGRGRTTIGGVTLDVGPTTVLQVPPGVPHSFTVLEDLEVVQWYTPAGPEARFEVAP